MQDDTKRKLLNTTDPPMLFAILVAARRTGDKMLERVTRRELEQKHLIDVRFMRPRREETVNG